MDENTNHLPAIFPPNASGKQWTPPVNGEGIVSGIGNYLVIGDKIGEGNFGIVYACTDVWGNHLAAKVIKPITSYSVTKSAAVSELKKLVELRNPFITHIYDAFEYRDTFYIITERCYAPIASLFALDGFNGFSWIMPIARCLLQAVNYLHMNRYVHQDIHLDNVFYAFARDEMVPKEPKSIQFKLGDLGVAKLFDEISGGNTRARWMLPPEVLNEREFGPVDFHIDIYHLGLLFLQLAYSRKIEFNQEEILSGKPRDMALALGSPYDLALEKALRRHVDKRTQSVREFWDDLNLFHPRPAPIRIG